MHDIERILTESWKEKCSSAGSWVEMLLRIELSCVTVFFSWCACNPNICLTLQMRLIIFTINTGVPSQIKYKNVYKHRYIFWWYSNTNFSGGRSYLGYVLTSALGAKISLVNVMENGESIPHLHIMENPLKHPNVSQDVHATAGPGELRWGESKRLPSPTSHLLVGIDSFNVVAGGESGIAYLNWYFSLLYLSCLA